MARVAIVVEFTIRPGSWQAFNTLIRGHASATLAEEPGCERFDVLQPRDGAGVADESRILLCEIYRDQAAFDAHGRNPRLAKVREAYAPLLTDRKASVCSV